MSTSLTILTVAGAVILLLALSAIRIVREYERVVVFRLGRLRAARGPGLVLVIPLIERARWVNLQVDTADIPPQDLITKDNVTIRVEAAVFYRVVDPVKAVVAIRDYKHAILRIAQTTLRATLGQHELDDLLANQAAINELLQQTIDASTEPWGVTVVKVETKDVDLPDTMKRAMARQAEAERERRAKVIAAEGEYQAAERLSQAAGVIAREPGTLTLRTLQTLAEVATEHNSTLVLPIPMDVLDAAHRAHEREPVAHDANGGHRYGRSHDDDREQEVRGRPPVMNAVGDGFPCRRRGVCSSVSVDLDLDLLGFDDGDVRADDEVAVVTDHIDRGVQSRAGRLPRSYVGFSPFASRANPPGGRERRPQCRPPTPR